MYKPSLRTSVVIGVIVGLLLPFVIVSWYNFTVTKQWAREEIVDTILPLTRENIVFELSRDFAEPFNVARTMSINTFVIDWVLDGENNTDEMLRYLSGIQEKTGYFSVFFISNKTGRYYHYDKISEVISPNDESYEWFYDFLKSGLEKGVVVSTNKASGPDMVVFIDFRVQDDDGTPLGVIGVGLRLQDVARHLLAAESKYRRTIYAVDSAGYYQMHTKANLVNRGNICEEPGLEDICTELLEATGEPSSLVYRSKDGLIHVTGRFMDQMGWTLVVEQGEAESLRGARLNFARTIILGMVVSVLIIWLAIRYIDRTRQQLEAQARTDTLTGLANRRSFNEKFSEAVSHFERYGTEFVIILLDFDKFKRVNDELGHIAGDELLMVTAKAMSDILRPTDSIARWGGDEFIVLAYCSDEAASTLAERLRNEVERHGQLLSKGNPDDPRSVVTFSHGITRYRSGLTLDEITSSADELLYDVKAEKKKG